jgi:MFS transporter, ACS family, pantothenate transporter
MIGGFIQAGIFSSMNGKHGLTGWRWLFIIDGVITLPVAIYGFLFFPDTPQTTTAFYITDAEKALAIARVPQVEDRSPLSWAFFKKILTSWPWWGFVVLYVLDVFHEHAALD